MSDYGEGGAFENMAIADIMDSPDLYGFWLAASVWFLPQGCVAQAFSGPLSFLRFLMFVCVQNEAK